MAEVSTYSHHDFPLALNWQAVSFMRVEWPHILLNGHRLGTETYPAEDKPTHFVVSERGVLISYAAMMLRPLHHAGASYRMAAVGNVFTFPAFRGEGYGRQVVAAAVATMQSSAADVGVLFCKPHLVHFYQLNGWEHIDAPTYLGTPAQPTHHPYQRMMQFLSDHGRQGHATFAQQPLYIESPW
jgi:GNAT superfamily N-acetyltransferase